MGKITLTFVLVMALTFVLIMALSLCSISSIRDPFERKKFALILPANYSKLRHEVRTKPRIPLEDKNYSYCLHFEVVKNIECLSKREVNVLCERPAMDESLICKGDGFYGLNTYFLNLQNNCLGEWKKLNRTSICNAEFIFV